MSRSDARFCGMGVYHERPRNLGARAAQLIADAAHEEIAEFLDAADAGL